ncbi:MAG TPA: NUDIX domain-containing protein [Burkholderiales bacterium]|nr:NUDIX domain-containing protein [Burkholderiales bacterium]
MEKPISAGVIPARRTPEGWKLLILRAYRNWDFPKGVIDPGEEPLAAAKREAAEEAALTDLAFPFGEIYRDTAPYSGGKIARYYLAVTKQVRITLPVSEELGRPEHDEGRWVSLAEAQRQLPPRLQPIIRWVKSVLAPTTP